MALGRKSHDFGDSPARRRERRAAISFLLRRACTNAEIAMPAVFTRFKCVARQIVELEDVVVLAKTAHESRAKEVRATVSKDPFVLACAQTGGIGPFWSRSYRDVVP